MLLQELSRSRFWDSFREMERLQGQLNRLFDGYRPESPSFEFPPLNIWSCEDSVLLTAEIPGLTAADIEISVVNETLTLRGSRQPEELGEGEKLHRKERGFGQFARTIQLPFRVDGENVDASFKKGVLEVRLPRAEQDKPRKISVKAE